jgi:hypothetical protein
MHTKDEAAYFSKAVIYEQKNVYKIDRWLPI